MAKFVATHGVHLSDLDVAFQRDRAAEVLDESGRSHARYSYETEDRKQAAELRKLLDAGALAEYGVVEVDAPKPEPTRKPRTKSPAQDPVEPPAADD